MATSPWPFSAIAMSPRSGNADALVVVAALGAHREFAGPCATTTAAPAAETLELGVVAVTADQVRCGTGFSVSCSTDTCGGG